ncbi:unknown [Bacteroides sp. CAG:1060]|nr:unknown [Bacteroides sp. CAG:1060]
MEYFSKIRTVPNDTVDVRISGINSSYPPDISAIKKIAVIGACITPAIKAAIPTRTKFCSGTLNPTRLKHLATMNPSMAPENSVGPNVPPTPPPEFVRVIATIFKKRIRVKNIGIPHL